MQNINPPSAPEIQVVDFAVHGSSRGFGQSTKMFEISAHQSEKTSLAFGEFSRADSPKPPGRNRKPSRLEMGGTCIGADKAVDEHRTNFGVGPSRAGRGLGLQSRSSRQVRNRCRWQDETALRFVLETEQDG